VPNPDQIRTFLETAQQTEKPLLSTGEGAFFIVARDRIELPTHGFSVHVPSVVKYKKRQENGARI